MPQAYTEDQLVEQPAIGLFAELGWQTAQVLEEVSGREGTLTRETPGEVVLLSRLRSVLERLNPALPAEAISAAVDELTVACRVRRRWDGAVGGRMGAGKRLPLFTKLALFT